MRFIGVKRLVQTALPSNSVRTAHTGRPRNYRSAIDPRLDTSSVLPSARPSSRTDPGSNNPRSSRPSLATIKPCTTTPREPGGIASRTCNTTRATHTSIPSDQKVIVPRPAETFDQYHPSGRTRRTNEESLGHDRPDRADS
ncbi:unnamed protein product [Microthlaspi erraticum]|uniref:Uncharacterized protein n=1 Tax=Microthlaspi erraticum TaxID=1685480 RepID=A0A6D2IQD5_9BRAS|nr:unnamed protein product [Microthlaspi erraticum]